MCILTDGGTNTTDKIFQKLLEIQQSQHKIQQDNTEILKSLKTLKRDVSELNFKTENIKNRIDDLPDNMSQASSQSERVYNFLQNTNTNNFNSTVRHRRAPQRKRSPRDRCKYLKHGRENTIFRIKMVSLM